MWKIISCTNGFILSMSVAWMMDNYINNVPISYANKFIVGVTLCYFIMFISYAVGTIIERKD